MVQINPTRFILYGGGQLNDTHPFFDDLWVMDYNLEHDGWEYALIETQEDPDGFGRPPPSWGGTLVLSDTTLILFGGQTDTREWANDTWSLPAPHPHTSLQTWRPTWQKVHPTPTSSPSPHGRHGHTLTPLSPTTFFLFGGWGNPKPWSDILHTPSESDTALHPTQNSSTQFNDAYILTIHSPTSLTWQKRHLSQSPPPRCGHVATYLPSRASVLIHGGRGEDYSFWNDTWVVRVGVERLRDLCYRRVRRLVEEGVVKREVLVEVGLVESA